MEIRSKIDVGAGNFDAIEFARRTVKALLPARARALLPKVLRNAPLVLRAWPVFKRPVRLVRHYLNHTSPPEKCIRLRKGGELVLCGHHLDMDVLFQVFCDRVYPVDPATVVVDIGANIGLFSSYAAFSGAEKVYAFEPNREAHDCMLENIRRNDLQDIIVPSHYAVTSRSDDIVTIPKAASPQNRIARGNADDEHEWVTTISLDDIVSREGLSRIDLLKMDCEGSEYDILASVSAATFSIIGRIIIEYHDGKEQEIAEDLRRHGFRLEKQVAESGKMGMLWFRKDGMKRAAK